jgi:hypothetical protein
MAMPFASFVWVNHHDQSILFEAGLPSNKDTCTFVWLFESWLKCMNGRASGTILIYQFRAMKKMQLQEFFLKLDIDIVYGIL